MSIRKHLAQIAALTNGAGTKPTATPIPGVLTIKGDVPQHQLAAVYEPTIGFVVQGGKTLSIGNQIVHLKAPSYFVVPTETPAAGRVHQGENGLPYLSVGLRLNHESLLDLLQDIPSDLQGDDASIQFSACPATEEFIEAWVRMLGLIETPEHIPALAPVYEREILYRVLLGPQGWRLRRLCMNKGKASGIRQAVRSIRENHAQSIDVKRLAAKSGMGVTTFHRQFKQITGLSPIQFQKHLRLLEARKLLAFGGLSVSGAAFEVGYESASQFNREYSRLFGASPARDASAIREMRPS